MTETSGSQLVTAAEAARILGVTAAPLREAFVASMGDPYEPHHGGSRCRPPPSSCWSAPTWRRSRSPTPRSQASTSCWR